MAGDGRDAGDAGDADRLLSQLGAALGAQLVARVPSWVIREVERILDAWESSAPAGPEASGDAAVGGRVDRAAVTADAVDAGRRAATDVGDRLRAVLAADVDAQSTTPLEVVRAAVAFPTGVLRRAGVPPVVREAFDEARFPDDVYGLTPPSLAAVDPSLTDAARAWGAAKAMAHKARHRGSSS